MSKIRIFGQHASLVLAGLVAVPVVSFAVVLGKPEVQSHIAQPLILQLPIEQIGGETGGVAALHARVLPESDYARYGLPAPAHPVNDLKVAIVQTANGQARLIVRSAGAVREPLLSLLVELRWGLRSIVRQVDLLLDPPDTPAVGIWAGSTPAQRLLDEPAPQPVLETAEDKPDTADPAPFAVLASLPKPAPAPVESAGLRLSAAGGRFTLAARFDSLRDMSLARAATTP